MFYDNQNYINKDLKIFQEAQFFYTIEKYEMLKIFMHPVKLKTKQINNLNKNNKFVKTCAKPIE